MVLTQRYPPWLSQDVDNTTGIDWGDIDNDGDTDDSDKYLANRRKAIAKAIKKTFIVLNYMNIKLRTNFLSRNKDYLH